MLRVTRSEWARALALALIVVVVTSVPYALGLARSNAEHVYSGATLDLVDYNSYLAKMQQGASGRWRFILSYTSEDHSGAFVYLFYLFLGHVVRWTGWSMLAVYQAARMTCALAMMLAMYALISALLPARPLRWFAYVLASLGSGLGWLQLLIAPTLPGGISPIDLWLIDGFPFFSALTFPHFTAAITLMSLTFVGLLEILARPMWRVAALTAVCSLGLTAIHPFGGGLVIIVTAVYTGLRVLARQLSWRRAALGLVTMALPAAPVLVYDMWLFSTQPAFRAWSEQNITLSPPPGYYLASYGLLLALGILGAVRIVKRRDWTATLAVIWVAAVVLLLYAPTSLQRRFLEGVMLPLCVLVSVGAVALFRRALRARRWRRRALVLIVALSLPSNLVLAVGTSVASLTRSPSVFYSGDVVRAVDWLSVSAGPDDVVLASFAVGNLIPARTGRRALLYHWMETPDYDRKADQVRRFFDSATSDETRRELLRDGHIRFVFVGPDERALGSFDPSRAPYLLETFRTGDVTIYRVELL
jgi:hypothetical protein